MKTEVSIEQCVVDLDALFNITPDVKGSSMRYGNKYMINKQDFERLMAIDMLQEYFADKVIDGGYLKVDGITFVFTTFEIIEGKP